MFMKLTPIHFFPLEHDFSEAIKRKLNLIWSEINEKRRLCFFPFHSIRLFLCPSNFREEMIKSGKTESGNTEYGDVIYGRPIISLLTWSSQTRRQSYKRT